jgi:hypothetical protein
VEEEMERASGKGKLRINSLRANARAVEIDYQTQRLKVNVENHELSLFCHMPPIYGAALISMRSAPLLD